MVMLDSLMSGTTTSRDSYLCATLAQSWLLQAVERGDMIRILEPLLIMLMHPDTARSLLLQDFNTDSCHTLCSSSRWFKDVAIS